MSHFEIQSDNRDIYQNSEPIPLKDEAAVQGSFRNRSLTHVDNDFSITTLPRAKNSLSQQPSGPSDLAYCVSLEQRKTQCLNRLAANLAQHLGSTHNDDGLYEAIHDTLTRLVDIQQNGLTPHERNQAKEEFHRLVKDLDRFATQTQVHAVTLLMHTHPEWSLSKCRQLARQQDWWKTLAQLGFDPAVLDTQLKCSHAAARREAFRALTHPDHYGSSHNVANSYLDSIQTEKPDMALELYREIVLMADQTDLYQPSGMTQRWRALQNQLPNKDRPLIADKQLSELLNLRVQARRALQRNRETIERTMADVFDRCSKKNLKAMLKAARREAEQIGQVSERKHRKAETLDHFEDEADNWLEFDYDRDDQRQHQIRVASRSPSLQISDDRENADDRSSALLPGGSPLPSRSSLINEDSPQIDNSVQTHLVSNDK